MADAKRKRAAGDEPEKGGYVRLAPSVAKFMGVKYCKESELTLSMLLSYERSKGRISECLELVRITVTTLDGKTTTHTLGSDHHTVRDLKFIVEEEKGASIESQRFSYAPTASGAAKVSGNYLPDGEPLKDGAALSLYIHPAKWERPKAVERSLAKVAERKGLKGFFDECGSLTWDERLIDAEMALFGKYSDLFQVPSGYVRRIEALEKREWDKSLGTGLGFKQYTSWHPSSKKRAANPECIQFSPCLFPRVVVVDRVFS